MSIVTVTCNLSSFAALAIRVLEFTLASYAPCRAVKKRLSLRARRRLQGRWGVGSAWQRPARAPVGDRSGLQRICGVPPNPGQGLPLR